MRRSPVGRLVPGRGRGSHQHCRPVFPALRAVDCSAASASPRSPTGGAASSSSRRAGRAPATRIGVASPVRSVECVPHIPSAPDGHRSARQGCHRQRCALPAVAARHQPARRMLRGDRTRRARRASPALAGRHAVAVVRGPAISGQQAGSRRSGGSRRRSSPSRSRCPRHPLASWSASVSSALTHLQPGSVWKVIARLQRCTVRSPFSSARVRRALSTIVRAIMSLNASSRRRSRARRRSRRAVPARRRGARRSLRRCVREARGSRRAPVWWLPPGSTAGRGARRGGAAGSARREALPPAGRRQRVGRTPHGRRALSTPPVRAADW